MADTGAVVIIGASSAVAQSLALLHAKAGRSLILLARSEEKLSQLEAHYLAHGANSVNTIRCELADVAEHTAAMQALDDLVPIPSEYYLFYGSLPDQTKCEQNSEQEQHALTINFLSATSWLNLIAQRLERLGAGTIAVVSSVAGDRGRQSNYVYGAAKGGLSIYLQGLRNRMHARGVNVLTVKPGFIDTPMTEAIEKNFLWASPEKVAQDIQKAVARKKNVLYTPWFWRYIMWIIKLIPESLFKRLLL